MPIPLLIPLIGAGVAAAGAAATAAPSLTRDKGIRYSKEQIERLQALAAKNQLGLTSKEKQYLGQAMRAPAEKSVQDIQTLLPQGGITQETTSGQAELQRNLAIQQQGQVAAEAGREAEKTIYAMDQAKEQSQRAELEGRLRDLAAHRHQQEAAALAPLAAGAEGFGQGFMFNQLVRPTSGKHKLSGSTRSYELYDMYQDDPEALQMILAYEQATVA